ncbi:ubiquitin-like protein Pup [Actinomyces haliotis]|uniref:ubiquitin-like protein Pup n=1 Tax=Actinomyces haliotis TaxID=1280843 RepID=UPI00189030FE|nr:ubiquitin-like protein Pup [Actinomyces haliotis]
MSVNSQIQPTGGPDDSEDAGTAASTTGQTQVSGVDDILDEIDSVLETNAAAFVQGFVQKGGE